MGVVDFRPLATEQDRMISPTYQVNTALGDNHLTSDVTISWIVHVTHGYSSRVIP